MSPATNATQAGPPVARADAISRVPAFVDEILGALHPPLRSP